MAQRKLEAWITSAVEEGVVANAVVLAESLRKTRTSRTIGAITSRNVSTEKQVALRKAFDVVFYMDESCVPNVIGHHQVEEDIRAKVFAFSMHFLDKLVFISANSLVLENADSLFEDKVAFKVIPNADDDLSLFMCSPNRDMTWEHLWESIGQNVLSENCLRAWFMDQNKKLVKMGTISDDVLVKFSMKTGTLLTDKTHAPIVQFVDATMEESFTEQLQLLIKIPNMGLREKLIITSWLEMHFKSLVDLLKNPQGARPLLGLSTKDVQEFIKEPIAIIGMSCRYPGANTLEEFWDLLYQGEEGVRQPPPFRWTKEHSLRVTQNERKTNAGFLLTTVDEFDAKFFGVSPKEAAYMDPQIRLLHEVLWESLQDSGIDPLSLHGTHTGIFTGSWMHDYKDIIQGSTEREIFRTYMGNSIGAGVARLSFLLGLTGPSIATESGCSSAIVALDLAVKSLRCGETNLALAGGVNLLLHPFTSNIMDYVIAADGRCKTFDSKADGFGRAEGCGVLILKRMSDALRDRDNIWALIRGSAVSQEGLSRSLGTPTVHCEALAMQLALEDANVKPKQVSFVETHGTGTSVGDPMEVAAIAKAYYSPERREPLVIGSVKTNVGHTESCSGITGIMKTVLAMQHELIPKHRNLETLNPEIFLDSIPAMIPMEPVTWPKVLGQPRIAGVSSFGITGTDGHVIIQEAPDYELPKFTLELERPTHIMKISAKSSEAVEELLKEYQNLFSERANKGDESFSNGAYSANIGRATFSHRAFIVASNYQDAVKVIQENQVLRGEVKEGENRQICFLFTGQGSQYQGMAKSLYDTSPIFRINFDACDRTLREMYNLSIRHVLWESDPCSKELSRTIYSQTSIFCVEYCLLKLWQSWGIQPEFVLGHSLGEFAAAVAAGILDFEDALKLVAERSRLIDNLAPGSMLVIKASKQEVEKLMKSANADLDFAAVNNPEQTVVAGDTEKIQDFMEYLKGHGIKAVLLEATHAFHSRHMDPMLEEYRKVANTINYKQGNANVKYVSGMEGRIISEINADYWIRHTREKVSFVDACAALRYSNVQEYLEIGPQPILSSFVMMNNENSQMTCLPSLRRGTDDWQTILTTIGKLYILGYKVNWNEFDGPYLRNKVSLPFHPFQRKSFWIECSNRHAPMIHPLVGYNFRNASTLTIFQNDLNVKAVPYLMDHCIGNRMVFPGAGFIEMCLSAGYCVANGLTESMEPPRMAIRLENLRIEAPLELKEGKACRLQVIVDLPEAKETSEDEIQQKQGFRVRVFHQNTSSEDSGKWIPHASAMFIPVAPSKDFMKKWSPDRIKEIIEKVEPTSADAFYKRVDESGLKFGKSFRGIQRHWNLKKNGVNLDEVVSEIFLPVDHDKYLVHPLIIDAVFQTGVMAGFAYDQTNRLKVPVSIGQMTLLSSTETETSGDGKCDDVSLYLHCWTENDKKFACIVTNEMIPVAYAEDMEFIDTNVRTIESILEQQSSSIPDAWEEIWRQIPGPFSNNIDLVTIKPLFSDEEFRMQLGALSKPTQDEYENFRSSNRIIYLYVLNTLYDLGWTPSMGECIAVENFCDKYNIKPQFQKLVRFYFTTFQEENMMEFVGSTKMWKVTSIPPPRDHVNTEIQHWNLKLKDNSLLANVLATYEHISHMLAKILVGKESALALLFPTDEDKQQFSAEQYYQNHPGRQGSVAFGKCAAGSIVDLQHKVNEAVPGRVIRVLEVGSGTGSMCQHVLEILRESWGDKFEYYYTDISQGFFAKAEKKFEEYSGNMKFAVFNLEQSPLEQGIPLNYFDIVMATDVLHATRNLQESLIHIRQTMRPKAILYFTETIIEARDITYVFGLLEGYWRFEDVHLRPHHACVNEQVWAQVLTECGFHVIDSTSLYAGNFACFAAEASDQIEIDSLVVNTIRNQQSSKDKKEWVIFCKEEDTAAQHVSNMLYASGANVLVVFKSADAGAVLRARTNLHKNISIKNVSTSSGNVPDVESLLTENLYGIVYGWGMDTKDIIQEHVSLPFLDILKWILVQKIPPVLYVLTQGVHSINESISCNPSAATLFGMAKSLKNENEDLFVRYVDLEYGIQDSKKVADQILFELAMRKRSKEGIRLQIAYRDSRRCEPKMVKATISSKHDELQVPLSSDRYHLVLPKTRLIQDLEFNTLETEEVKENEVEIKVKAFALNFKDILTILKPSAEFEQLNTVGLDFAGVVSKVGSKVLAKFKVGDKVFGANFKEAQLPSHLVLDADGLLRIPDKMTFWEAATLPAVFATAYHCLINIAKMKKGDIVLIHTGSGGVGLASIQLAKHVGATIITTAGNERKRAYLRGIGVEHVFHSRNTSYEQDIMRVTRGRGVDVVLNSITGPGLKEATLATCAKNARFVEMSKLSIWTTDEVKVLRSDVDYTIVDLTALEKETWKDLLQSMKEYLNHEYVQPIPYVKFDALNIRQALQFFQKAKHIGKVVCVMPEVTTQDGLFKSQVPMFNNESTYLITGGLGGIGFEVGQWMLEKGATDIMLMGRSPPKPDIAAIIEDLRKKKGFNIMVRQGDVSNFQHCKNIVDEICQHGKPLRGVMHCAGVLSDNLYANQTWESFETTFKPKVTGTWNLHNLTKEMPLEHFVLYSSVTAMMGTPGQPNHAAANCFEDAFAHYRHSMGLAATSINWGQWAQVGCAKDITITGVLPVSFKRMLNGLELALKTQRQQICFAEFESFASLLILCPINKSYVDERLWKVSSTNQNNQALNAEKFWSEMDATESRMDKTDIVITYVKIILRGALLMASDEPLNEDVNIRDLGVDSLMSIELKNSIQTLLGSRVNITVSLLKDCNTIRELAVVLVNKIMEDSENEDSAEPLPADELIQLLYQDCQLNEGIQSTTSSAAEIMKPSKITTILFTGVTGQLGGCLLFKLSTQFQNVDNIVCLVREREGTTLESRVTDNLKSFKNVSSVDMTKLEFVAGDVAKPNLGLDQQVYDRLAESVDAVIHCAAKPNNIEHYKNHGSEKTTDVRSVNVGGTINILKFASTQKTKQIYYASNFMCAAFGDNDRGALSDEWPKNDVLKSSVEGKLPGLPLSKFVCELLLKEANLRGIPCKVFRFPWIAGNSQTGHLDYLNNVYILRYLSFLKVKAMPSLPIPANILPIDTCADLSLKLFFNDETPFEIFNIGHPHPQVEQEFVHVAQEDFGKDLDILEWKEFAERLEDPDTQIDGMKDLYRDMKKMNLLMAEAVAYVEGYLAKPDTFFRNDKVSKFIPGFERDISPSMEIIRKDFQYLKSIGLLDKFVD